MVLIQQGDFVAKIVLYSKNGKISFGQQLQLTLKHASQFFKNNFFICSFPMSYSPNQPNLYQSTGQDDLMEQNQPMSDEQHSFTSAKLKLQNWENMNDFEDSEMVIESSSDCIEVESPSNQSFIEDTKKALGEFQELKQMQYAKSIKLEEPFIEYQAAKRLKHFEKTKRIGRRRHISRTQYFLPQSPIKEDYKLGSLKNISSQVCDYVEMVQKISYPDLFNKFVNEKGSESKNLKRRMYDVINVLSSAKVLKKKGVFLTIAGQKISQANSEIQNHKDPKFSLKNELRRRIEEKEAKIREKKMTLQEIRGKKRNLERLFERNQAWSKRVPKANKIPFPFLCFVPGAHTKCQVNPTEAKLVFVSNEEEYTQVLTQIEAISHVNLRAKKAPPKMRVKIAFETLKGLSTIKKSSTKKP